MRVYQYDKEGLYVGSRVAPIDPVATANDERGDVVYFPLPNATSIVPPSVGENEIAKFEEGVGGDSWVVLPDYRGETVYSVENGSPLLVVDVGEIPFGYTLQKPELYQVYQDGEWVDDFAEMIAVKLAESERAFSDAMRIVSAKYPVEEREGWPEQKADLAAYRSDVANVGVVLQGLADANGIGVADMADRIETKVAVYQDVYTSLLAVLQGIRKTLGDIDIEVDDIPVVLAGIDLDEFFVKRDELAALYSL